MTNMETLTNAGLIKDPGKVSKEMQNRINALSADEITHLISIKGKLGDEGLSAHNDVMCL